MGRLLMIVVEFAMVVPHMIVAVCAMVDGGTTALVHVEAPRRWIAAVSATGAGP